jgi:hypothetical protein
MDDVKKLIESIQTFCRDTGVSVEQLLAQTNTHHYTVSRPRGLAKEHPAKSGSTRFMWVRDAPVAVSCGDERPKVDCLDGDDNVAPVVAKRGPGRPKKVDGVDNVEAPVAAKRCPGIQPKLDSEDNVEAPVVAKRGRGRPKKVDGVDNVEAPVAAKRCPGIPPKLDSEDNVEAPVVAKRGRGRPKKVDGVDNVEAPVAAKRCPGIPPKLDSEDNVEAPVVAKRGRGRPKKVDGEKAERKSPTTKAKDVGLGAKEIGNDGKDWEVVQRGTEDSKRGLFLVWKQVA